MFKKILSILFSVLLVSGLIIILFIVYKKHKETKCNKIEISIKNSENNGFVTKKDIEKIIFNYDKDIIGKEISKINVTEIEEKIKQNPYISNVNVFINNDGSFKINLTQRIAMFRVINNRGVNFYVDKDGYMMPLSNKYTPRIIIVHGNINSDFTSKQKLINFEKNHRIDTNKLTDLQKVFYLCEYIDKSEFWKAMVEEIFVEKNSDLILYVAMGNQAVNVGNPNNLNEKFSNLQEFYKQKMNKIGWKKYKTINLKYKNQIVCTKS